MSVENRLQNYLQDLAKLHGAHARPVLDYSDNVTVEFGLRVIRFDVNEGDNTIYLSAWARHVSIVRERA